MLTENELALWFSHLGLSSQARDVLITIRNSPPHRLVGSRKQNVSTRYASHKMGRVVQAESHTVELSGVYEYEFADEVLEFYDQPPAIKLNYGLPSGRQIGCWHTPDYFVMRRECVGWEEWKTEAELLKLAERAPERYQRNRQGVWCCPPGERVAKPLGFYYRVRTSAEVNWIFQRNARFLEDYRSGGNADRSEIGERINCVLREHPGILLAELLADIGTQHADVIYTLIAKGKAYVDLQTQLLVEKGNVQIFPDRITADSFAKAHASQSTALWPPSLQLLTGTPLSWDGQMWTLVNDGTTFTTLLSETRQLVELPTSQFQQLIQQGHITSLLSNSQTGTMSQEAQHLMMKANPRDLEEANRRYGFVQAHLKHETHQANTPPPRTLREWSARYRAAEQALGCGYVGLLPHWQNSGNFHPKLPEATIQILNTFIAERYEAVGHPSKKLVWGELVIACQERGIQAPSYKTFAKAVKARPRHEQQQQRLGHRIAYSQASFYWELDYKTPRHGERPFEICHLDHTELDLELTHSQSGQLLGRPWISFLVDAFSRRILAFAVAFERPSGSLDPQHAIKKYHRILFP